MIKISHERNPTNYQKRLFDQINGIEDVNLREMISECVYIEYKYRSAASFPIKQIKDLVDNYAGLSEGEAGQ